MKFDLVVIGAGPAGSMAARTAARAGLSVALVEKRQEIGSPVRCAEGVSKAGLHALIKPDPSWISSEVKGARVFGPDGSNIVISEDHTRDEVGYILERKIFDRDLAVEAASFGTEMLVKTRATGLIRRQGRISGVSVVSAGEPLEIESSLVIGADGVESRVSRFAGLSPALKPEEMMICLQYLVSDPGLDSDYCRFYLGNEIAPGGYIWSLPKGDGLANVGVCILGSRSVPGLARTLLDSFIRGHIPQARILDMVAGGIPISGPSEAVVSDGIMLAGDAARQADPFTCGGILSGMSAGVMAGRVAAEAISSGDVSRRALQAYELEWKKMSKPMERHGRLRTLYGSLSDAELNQIMRSLGQEDTAKADLDGLSRMLFRLNPRLLWKMRHLVI